jgi:hypothetical protein
MVDMAVILSLNPGFSHRAAAQLSLPSLAQVP